MKVPRLINWRFLSCNGLEKSISISREPFDLQLLEDKLAPKLVYFCTVTWSS